MKRAAVRVYVACANRLREAVDQDRERGLTTTEVAVLTFILVSIAVAIGVLLYNYSAGRVSDLDNVSIDPVVQNETTTN